VAQRPTVGAPNLPGPFVITRTFGETSMLLDRLRVPAPGAVCKLCIAVAAVWPATFATAQTAAQAATPTGAAASTPALTPAERAKRDGDQVFHWILIHSDKPRKPVAATKDEKPVAVARVKPPARAAVRVDEPVVEVSASATPATTSSVAPAVAEPEPKLAVEAGPASVKVATAAATIAAPSVPVAEDDAVESLKPVSQTEPKFPVNLLRTLRTGQVQVKFTVLPDGSVAEPAVVATSNPRLNPSALAAVAQWRFAPLRKPQQGIVDLGFNNAE
jgi:TonB family protein